MEGLFKILHDLFDNRLDADYDLQIDPPTLKQASDLFEKAKKFYETALEA